MNKVIGKPKEIADLMPLFSALAAMVLLQSAICVSSEVAPPEPTPQSEKSTSSTFSEKHFGCTFTIPEGFIKLSEKDHRQALQGMAEMFGTDAGARLLRRPPVWFTTKLDPTKPDEIASLWLGWAPKETAFTEGKLEEYKKTFIDSYAQRGFRFGELELKIVVVNGVNSLRVDHTRYNPKDKSQWRMTRYFIPAIDRLYEASFEYPPEWREKMEEKFNVFQSSFVMETIPPATVESEANWYRVMKFTIGFFFIGMILHYVLRALAGIGEKSVMEEENISPPDSPSNTK